MTWKPDPAEAQFLGEVMAVDCGLAEIARGMLAKGVPLNSVIGTYKDAVRIAQLLRSGKSA